MEKHGVSKAGWRFRWTNAKKELGSAGIRTERHHRTRKVVSEDKSIALSRHLVRLNDEAEVRDTILHEIAHALAGIEHGHDAVWQAVCRKIGAKPNRIADQEVNVVEPRYRLMCGCCDRILARRHQRMTAERIQRTICTACGKPSLGKLYLYDRLTEEQAPLIT